MIPPAPGLFSTTNGWPSDFASWSATTRPRISVAEPGVNGTITFTALLGYCADAMPGKRSKASTTARSMSIPKQFCHYVERKLASDGRTSKARGLGNKKPGSWSDFRGSGEIGVDLRHDGGALADRAADALHRARAHVADRENARHARLQRQLQVLRRRDEAAVVDRHVATLEPLGARLGAEEEEHVADPARLGLARVAGSPADRLDAGGLRAAQADELGARQELD